MGLFSKPNPFRDKVVKVLTNADEQTYFQALYEISTKVMENNSIKENRKLLIYDDISRLQNCLQKDRKKYINRLKKHL